MRAIKLFREFVFSWSFFLGGLFGMTVLFLSGNYSSNDELLLVKARNQQEIETILDEQSKLQYEGIMSGLQQAGSRISENIRDSGHSGQKRLAPVGENKILNGDNAGTHSASTEGKPKTTIVSEVNSIVTALKVLKLSGAINQTKTPTTKMPGGLTARKETNNKAQTDSGDGVGDSSFKENLEGYKSALRKYEDGGLILISSVDSAYIDLGLNLYHTSFKKFNIQNYVFVASDADVCPVLAAQGINCVEFIHVGSSDKAEPFYTVAFMLKSFVKTKLVLEALRLNLRVLLVDVDMVFYKNPLDYITCEDCDIEAMAEYEKYHVINTGFYLAKPTQACIELHERAAGNMTRDARSKTLDGSDQKYVNKVLKEMRKDGTINSGLLDTKLFPNANTFFELGRRVYRGDRDDGDVVVLHNNFVVTLEAKVYRFKEYGLWNLDQNGYYSDNTTKYLTYDNPITITNNTDPGEVILRETKALKTALRLGALLKRKVILPSFHNYRAFCETPKLCKMQWETCSLQGIYYIQHFDTNFAGQYREHSFLSHSLVPDSVKQSVSPIYLFDSLYAQKELVQIPDDVTLLQPRQDVLGVGKQEIKELFARITAPYSVLRFHSLYVNVTDYASLEKRFKTSFTRTGYMQNPKGDKYLQKRNLKV